MTNNIFWFGQHRTDIQPRITIGHKIKTHYITITELNSIHISIETLNFSKLKSSQNFFNIQCIVRKKLRGKDFYENQVLDKNLYKKPAVTYREVKIIILK